MSRSVVVVVLSFLLFGCTTYELGQSFTGRDACGTGNCIAYIDFRDTGLLQDASRVDELLARLSTCKDKVVVVFVHGLQGSSREGSDYVSGFRNLLDQVSLDAKAYNAEAVGVYIGWRGQSWVLPAMAPLTFGARRDAAKSVAFGQFPEVLQRVTSVSAMRGIACERRPRLQVIVIGHSLGGSIVYEAVWRDVVRRSNEAYLASPNAPIKVLRSIDRVILVNPAIAAIDYAPFYQSITRFQFDASQDPIIETFFAKEDSVVTTWFSFFRRFETITFDPNEKRDLLNTPIGSVSQFVTHRLSSLTCDPSALRTSSAQEARPLPARVVRVEGVPELQAHGDVWNIAAACIQQTLKNQTSN